MSQNQDQQPVSPSLDVVAPTDIRADIATEEPAEQLAPVITIKTIQRLKGAFALAETLLTSEFRGRIWVIYGVVGGQAPTVASLESVAELCELIVDLRARHNSEPENEYFLHMFYGQRWSIQKGRVWKLWDGRMLMPIEGGSIEPFLDDSGGLGERKDPDTVVTSSPEAPSAAPVAPSPDEGLQLTPTPETEISTGPPVVGEEVAPPGADPEIE